MSRFPDPTRSRAVLIGASRYRDSGALPEIPAVRANLTDLRTALVGTTTGTLASESCTVVSEPAAVSDIGHAIATAAAEATDLLLVYYSGHGLVDERGRLHLTLSTTDPTHPRWTALPFDVLREEIAASPATTRVLVLDCCFSGRAIEAMSDTLGVITGQIDIAGTYTLTSTTANALSHAPVGATHTAFTGALLAVLSTPSPLTLDELFRHVDHHLAARGLPRPQRRTVNAAGDLALFKGSVTTAPPPTTQRSSVPPTTPAPEHTAVQSTIRSALWLVASYLPALLAALNVFLAIWGITEGGLRISEKQWLWTIKAYVLSFGALMVLGVLLGDRLGRRRMFGVGIAVFAVGSAECALAVDVRGLILGRVVQGVGAGLLFALSVALVTATVAVSGRGRAVAIWSAVAIWILAPVASLPFRSVVFVSGVGWRWTFLLVNVPVSLFALALVVALGALPERRGYIPRIDRPGLLIAGTGLLALLGAALELGPRHWGGEANLAMLAGGIVLLGAFAGRQWLLRANHTIMRNSSDH